MIYIKKVYTKYALVYTFGLYIDMFLLLVIHIPGNVYALICIIVIETIPAGFDAAVNMVNSYRCNEKIADREYQKCYCKDHDYTHYKSVGSSWYKYISHNLIPLFWEILLPSATRSRQTYVSGKSFYN